MLNRLNEALLELESEKEAILQCNFEDEIKKELEAAEKEIRAKYQEKIDSGLTDVEYQIKAVKKLISKEEAKIAEAAAHVAEAPVVASEPVAHESVAEAVNSLVGIEPASVTPSVVIEDLG